MAFKENNIIDVHTHLFNLKYLPVWGVLKSRGIGEKTSKFLEYLLLKITKESFSRQSDLKEFIDSENKEYPEIFSQLDDEELIELFIEISQNNDEVLNSNLLQEAIEENQEALLNLQPFILIENTSAEVYKFNAIRWIINKALEAFAYLRWFLFMTSRETKLLMSLKKNYPMVKTFVFHMLDTEFFFPGNGDFSAKAELSNEQQIANMKALIQQHPNKIKGFIGYNPERKNGLEIVKKAINEGFSGIKFYPPLGYKPQDSLELFKYCEKNNVPVFTHCTPTGFEAVEGESGKNANPDNWEVVLKHFPNLKLCLGHAGGVNGWFNPLIQEQILKVNSYAHKVVKLCQNYKGVYAEVGFLDHIENNKEEEWFASRLVSLFKNQTELYNFSTKIMYGSDWHVLMNHKGKLFKNYVSEFIKLLNRPEFMALENYKTLKENFFYENANNFLNKKI